MNGLRFLANPQVNHFDGESKSHGKVGIVFQMQFLDRFVEPTFQYQQESNQNQKSQCQNLHRRMAFDVGGDRSGKEEHDRGRNQDGRNHYPGTV